MKLFSPHSRQQDEREISRVQKNFTAGMFTDIADVQIPDNGVSYLKNFKNLGFALEGRTGSSRWGNKSNNTNHAALPNSDTLNAIYQHKKTKYIFIHLGTNIYVSRTPEMTAWELCHCESLNKPVDEESSFDGSEDTIFLFNPTNGIYKIDLFDSPSSIFYYRVNAEIPTQKITSIDTHEDPLTSGAIQYKRRVVYSLSKISGSGIGVNRTTPNVRLMTDSGSNLPDSNYQDYAVLYGRSFNASGMTIPNVSGTSNKERHWDFYSLWTTADVSPSGIDPISGIGNNTEAYVWLNDIPICQAYKGTLSSGSLIYMASFSGQQPAIEKFVNHPCYTHTLSSGLISGYLQQFGISSYEHTFSVSLSITDYNKDMVFFMGGGSGALLTASNGILTPINGNTFNSSDIGRRVFMSDGSKFHISGISGVSGLTVENRTITTSMAGSWREGEGTNITTNVWDESAWLGEEFPAVVGLTETQINSRLAGYPLFQRFYQQLPVSTHAKIIPGWMVVSKDNDYYMYQSQMPEGYEYLTGYYHPAYQFTRFEDMVKGYGMLLDKLVIYCRHSTYIIPTNVISSVSIEELGIDISLLSQQVLVDANIGLTDKNSLCDIELSKQMMITNDFGIRVFDGNTYSENYATQKIENDLRKMNKNFSAIYSPYAGYIFWGRQ
jgi:hypothetical protein